MMNVTISMDDELHRKTRIEAAKAGKSMSKYIADALLQAHITENDALDRQRRLDALQRVFDGPKLNMSVDGKMPSADERNARR